MMSGAHFMGLSVRGNGRRSTEQNRRLFYFSSFVGDTSGFQLVRGYDREKSLSFLLPWSPRWFPTFE